MKEEDIKIGVKIVFSENVSRASDGLYTHFINADNILVAETKYSAKVIFKIVDIAENDVVIRTVFPVRSHGCKFKNERYTCKTFAILDNKTLMVEDHEIDNKLYHPAFLNFRLHIDKNSYASSDKIKTIENIQLSELDDNARNQILCENRTICCVYEESSFYQEYDELYFQALDAEDALVVGLTLYKSQDKRDLPKINKYALYLFKNGAIPYDKALNITGDDAYEEFVEFRRKKFHIDFELPKQLKVFIFDTTGPYTYGEAIVVAKDKAEAIQTFRQYASMKGDMLNYFCLDPTEEEDLSTPLKEAKVISAWYDIC